MRNIVTIHPHRTRTDTDLLHGNDGSIVYETRIFHLINICFVIMGYIEIFIFYFRLILATSSQCFILVHFGFNLLTLKLECTKEIFNIIRTNKSSIDGTLDQTSTENAFKSFKYIDLINKI